MNILVVEDEIMAARHLCRVIREILQENVQSLHHVDTLDDAKQYLQSHGIDLLFLDLNLSGEDGFELLSDVVSSNFQTIIVSGNIDQALRSYEYGVLDFVPKPFTQARLSQALDKCRPSQVQTESGRGQAKYLGVRHLGKTLLVPIEDVTHIKAADRYTEISLADGKSLLHEKKLKQLLCILPDQFQQIHKSHIANLRFAKDIVSRPGSSYELCLRDGTILSVGRKFLPPLRNRLE